MADFNDSFVSVYVNDESAAMFGADYQKNWHDSCYDGVPEPIAEGDESSVTTRQHSVYGDTPYYHALIKNEMSHISLSSSILKDISSKATSFAKAGSGMSHAIRELSLSCQLRTQLNPSSPSLKSPSLESHEDYDDDGNNDDIAKLKKEEALGSEMAFVLNQLGKAFDKIATAQEQMCRVVQMALDSHLEEIAISEIITAKQLEKEANNQTKLSEKLFTSYLTSNMDEDTNNQKISSKSLEQNNLDISLVNDVSILPQSPSTKKMNKQLLTPSGRTNGSTRWYTMRSKSAKSPSTPSAYFDFDNDSSSTSSSQGTSGIEPSSYDLYNEYNQPSSSKVEMERTIGIAQVSAEICRFQLLKYLKDAKDQRNYEISHSIDDLFFGMQKYFKKCNKLLTNLEPCIKENFNRNVINKHNNKVGKGVSKKWKESAAKLHDTLAMIKEKNYDQLLVSPAEKGGKKVVVGNDNDGDCFSLWDLSTKLAEYSPYYYNNNNKILNNSCHNKDNNTSDNNIVLEGWLYHHEQEKNNNFRNPMVLFRSLTSTATCTTSSNIVRRWCRLKEDGAIYYLAEQNNNNASNTFSNISSRSIAENVTTGTTSNTMISETKLCDITSCSVRVLNADDNSGISDNTKRIVGKRKFCFELNTPDSNTSIILQAAGPMELVSWVRAITSH